MKSVESNETRVRPVGQRHLRPAANALRYASAAADAWRGECVRVAGLPIRVPGPRRIRLAVVGGNLRIHALVDAFAAPGSTVIDVGANIGYNTLYAAHRVGPAGCVVAVEPSPDNFAVLERNVGDARVSNVAMQPVAAGRRAGSRILYLRGDTSAVNSFFAESCYAEVTGEAQVRVERLDDLVDGAAHLVKIDVEGAELDVLEGMERLLRQPGLVLIVEWHPTLQAMAGYAPDALPRWLLERGWRLHAVSHLRARPCTLADVPAVVARLRRTRRPVELVALKPSARCSRSSGTGSSGHAGSSA